jgi:hypothetical protein
VVLSFWAFEKVKFYKSRHLIEMIVTDLLSCNNKFLNRMTAAVGSSSMPSAVIFQPSNMFSANGST